MARLLLDSIETDTIIGLRDRALIGVMVFSFARISAAVSMRVEDYVQAGKRWKFRFMEKGGKYNEVFAHHNAEKYLDAYMDASDIWGEKKTPLFRTIDRKLNLSDRQIHRTDALRMVKRRALAERIFERLVRCERHRTGFHRCFPGEDECGSMASPEKRHRNAGYYACCR